MSEIVSRSPIELHSWDADALAWCEPHELAYRPAICRHLVRKLRETHGSWHGALRSNVPGEASWRFRASCYDLRDAALATIDLEGSPGGPLEIVLVLPAARRHHARPELAFEFSAFVRFLEGPTASGSELAIHDHLERVLQQARSEEHTSELQSHSFISYA